MKMHSVCFVLLLGVSSAAVLRPLPAAAQPGQFARLGVGARAMALGGAFTGVADDPSASYWNPAGLAQLDNLSFMAVHHRMSLDRTFNFMSAAVPVGYSGSFALSWIGLGISGIEGRTSNSADPDFIFSNNDNALLLSYAHRITGFFFAGINLKLIYQKLYNADAFGAGFDASFLIKASDDIRIGFTAQDLGTRTRWLSGREENFPMVLRSGISFRLLEHLMLAVDAFKAGDNSPSFALGAEYRAANHVPVRLGYQDQDFVGGAGLEVPMNALDLSIDYAFGHDRLDGSESHRISLSLAFSKPHGAGKVREPASQGWQDYAPRKTPRPLDQPAPAGVEKPAPIAQFAVITAKALNVRSGPGIKYGKLGIVRQDQRFRIVEHTGLWYKVALPGNRFGWLYEKYIKIVP